MENKIFKKLSKEDIIFMKSTDFAHYGWEGKSSFSFWSMMEAYREGSNILFEKMNQSENHAEIDSLVYPFCFLKRHYMELCLKYFFLKYINKDETSIKGVLNLDHNVQAIWDKMQNTLKSYAESMGSSVDFGLLNDCIRSMQDFDSKSMQMRYPIDKNLNQQNEETYLDYGYVQSMMENFSKEMEKLDHDIDNQVIHSYTTEEREKFVKKYTNCKTKINQLLSLAKEKTTSRKKTELKAVSLSDIDMTNYDNKIDQFIDTLNGDESIIVKVLFYGGREVAERQINLPKGKSKKKEKFIDHCNFIMKLHNFEFGIIPDEYELDIKGKMPEVILKHIGNSISIIEE